MYQNINEWTQVYLNGMIPANAPDNLTEITRQLNNGSRTPNQIFSILRGMGIPYEKALYAVNNCMETVAPKPLGYIDVNKNNEFNMEPIKFNLNVLKDKIQGFNESLKSYIDDSANKITYSAQLCSDIADKYLAAVHTVIINLNSIKESDTETAARIKSRMSRYDIVAKSEYIYADAMLKELAGHMYLKPVSEFITEMNSILKSNKYSSILANTYKTLTTDKQSKFYESVVEEMERLLTKDEMSIREELTFSFRKYNWIPVIRAILEEYSRDTKKNYSNSEGNVNAVYSPVYITENKEAIFYLDNKFYNLKDTVVDIYEGSIPGNVLNTLKAMQDFKVDGKKMVMYHGKNTLEILTEDAETSVLVNGKKVDYKNINNFKNYLIRTSFYGLNEMHKLDQLLYMVESMDNIKNLDFITSISSKINNGIKVNVMRLGNNLYVNRINPHMGVNEFLKVNTAEEAQGLVNEYINFDISNSVEDLMKIENQKKNILINKKNEYIERLKFLEEKKLEIEKTISIIGTNDALKEALLVIEEEMISQEAGLQNTYAEMGEDGAINKKLLDMGYVLGSMKNDDGIFSAGMPIYVLAQDYTTKSNVEPIKIISDDGSKEGTVNKENISVTM